MSSQAKALYVLLCKEISTDSTDKMNSIIKVIDIFNFGLNQNQLNKEGKKMGSDTLMIPMDYSIATSWFLGSMIKKDTKAEVQINMLDSDKAELGGPLQKLLIPKGSDKINVNFSVKGFPLRKQGDYTLEAKMIIGNKTIAESYPFKVVVDLQEN